ncbi:hypothetical protein NQ314_005667 [Rhamnusium bicolor]|uniref:Nucleolar protein 58 n=1 Tax=Rhamnusium bicolor TaxID=1586634 RepID=A0AAV8ZG79_9CUCU|nr:hypothetical protein NQ314_005667 [Rhamnusium bicolor]
MLALFETPAGYAIFKLLDEKKLRETDNLYQAFETPEAAGKIVKLKHFEKFADTTEALAATTAAVEGKISKSLKKVLKKHVDKDLQEQLLVADAKLGSAIKEKIHLISGLPKKEMTAMALGLAHSLSRYKLKFSPDKVDTMIVQAVSLLDDLDKELNNYIMRCREWYGWHFPELGKIITDNVVFAKTVKIIGTRENTATSDLSDILPEEIEEKNLCDQVIDITNYRTQLYEYLKARMMAMAPNLTVLVGDLVGARLISHAGSLINLAKQPASTVQILGAEKALFRALKTKKDTPKYGLIYHSQLVGQSSTKNKGKMSRMLAAKASLATRVDALGEDGNFTLGAEHKAKLEARLRVLEEGNIRRISGTGKAKAKFEKYHGVSEIKHYPDAADSTLPSISKRKRSDSEMVKEEAEDNKEIAETKQKKKKLKKESEEVELSEAKIETEDTPKKKKKKIKQEKLDDSALQEEMEDEAEEPTSSKKKKKKKVKQELDESEIVAEMKEEPTSEKKKKKKKKKQSESE